MSFEWEIIAAAIVHLLFFGLIEALHLLSKSKNGHLAKVLRASTILAEQRFTTHVVARLRHTDAAC